MRRPSSNQTLLALALAGAAAASAHAQSAPSSLRLIGSTGAGKQVEVVADQPAHFAVFAVGRGSAGNPVQLLTNEGTVSGRPTKRITARPLAPGELGRFATSEQMVIVALAADAPANLDAFLANGRPAADLALSDSVVADSKSLIDALAGTVFSQNVRYTARVLPVEPQTIPLPPSVAMDHCGEIANPPAGGFPFSAATSPQPVVLEFAGTQRSLNDDSYGSVAPLRLPGCTAVVYRMMPTPPKRAPYAPDRPAPVVASPATTPQPDK